MGSRGASSDVSVQVDPNGTTMNMHSKNADGEKSFSVSRNGDVGMHSISEEGHQNSTWSPCAMEWATVPEGKCGEYVEWWHPSVTPTNTPTGKPPVKRTGAYCGPNRCCNDGWRTSSVGRWQCFDCWRGGKEKFDHKPVCNFHGVAPTCKCANGVAATGVACSYDGQSICATCRQGYKKNGNACTATPTPTQAPAPTGPDGKDCVSGSTIFGRRPIKNFHVGDVIKTLQIGDLVQTKP